MHNATLADVMLLHARGAQTMIRFAFGFVL